MRFSKMAGLWAALVLGLGAGSAIAADVPSLLAPSQSPDVSLLTDLPVASALLSDGVDLVAQVTPDPVSTVLLPTVTGVLLPSLDGLGTVLAPGANPLNNLSSALLQALHLSGSQAGLSQGEGALARPLPGLGQSSGIALPGLAGLPLGVAAP